jgi:hypothetical protein
MKRRDCDEQAKRGAEREFRDGRERIAAKLTAEEQAAIARFEAEKGVTRIPRGVSGRDWSATRTREERRAESIRIQARHQKFSRLRADALAPAMDLAMATTPPLRSPAATGRTNGATRSDVRANGATGPSAPSAAGLARVPVVPTHVANPAPIRPWDMGCRFEMVAVSALRVRVDAYQRQISRGGQRRVRAIAARFDWARFGTLVVREATDQHGATRFEIVDGQHRAAAARARGIQAVPAVVVAAEAAGVFLGLNRDRTALDPAQLYLAELAAGEPEAARLAAILERAGVAVPRMQPQKGLPPMATRSVAALRTELRARGPGLLVMALGVMARAWPARPNGFTIETIRGVSVAVAAILAERPPGGADAEMAALAATLAPRDPMALRASARSEAAKYGGMAHRHLARLVCNAHAARGGVAAAVGV